MAAPVKSLGRWYETAIERIRVPERAEISIDTARLAGFLIGKILARAMPFVA